MSEMLTLMGMVLDGKVGSAATRHEAAYMDARAARSRARGNGVGTGGGVSGAGRMAAPA
jgi:hypothetical protein